MSLEVEEQDLRALTEALQFGWSKVASDLPQVLAAAGYNVDSFDVMALAAEMEIAEDKPLNIEDLCKIALAIPEKYQATSVLKDSFANMNSYEDGSITIANLQLLLEQMAHLTKDEIDGLIKVLDPNNVGRIYLENFYILLSAKVLGG